MNVKIIDSKQIDVELVNELETSYNFKLPDDYRNFLIKYNGGHPEPNCFNLIMEDKKNNGIVQRFLRVSEEILDGIYYHMDVYEDRIPKKYFPIAYDPCGNLLLISVSENHYGEIFFWDHEQEYENEEEIGFRNMYFIEKSFSNFLNNLYDIEI